MRSNKLGYVAVVFGALGVVAACSSNKTDGTGDDADLRLFGKPTEDYSKGLAVALRITRSPVVVTPQSGAAGAFGSSLPSTSGTTNGAAGSDAGSESINVTAVRAGKYALLTSYSAVAAELKSSNQLCFQAYSWADSVKKSPKAFPANGNICVPGDHVYAYPAPLDAAGKPTVDVAVIDLKDISESDKTLFNTSIPLVPLKKDLTDTKSVVVGGYFCDNEAEPSLDYSVEDINKESTLEQSLAIKNDTWFADQLAKCSKQANGASGSPVFRRSDNEADEPIYQALKAESVNVSTTQSIVAVASVNGSDGSVLLSRVDREARLPPPPDTNLGPQVFGTLVRNWLLEKLGFPVDPSPPTAFSALDAKPITWDYSGNPREGAITEAINLGIVIGVKELGPSNTTILFQPKEPLTREQLAALTVNGLKQIPLVRDQRDQPVARFISVETNRVVSTELNRYFPFPQQSLFVSEFVDKDGVPRWSTDPVKVAVTLGLFPATGQFEPTHEVTLDEFKAFLGKIIDSILSEPNAGEYKSANPEEITKSRKECVTTSLPQFVVGQDEPNATNPPRAQNASVINRAYAVTAMLAYLECIQRASDSIETPKPTPSPQQSSNVPRPTGN